MNLTAVMADVHLHHLALSSPNPKLLAEFYSKTMDMKISQIAEDYWQCEGPKRKMVFKKGKKKTLLYAALSCRDLDGLNALKAKAKTEGLKIKFSKNNFFEDSSFGVNDPDNNLIIFGLVKKKEKEFSGIHAPLQHLTFASTNVEAFENFYFKKLGFAVSDRVLHKDGTMATCFTRSNHEHHTIACFKSKTSGIDHHSYETGDWAKIKDWCDRFSELGIKLMWGPGRHGPGNNLFIFIEDPDSNWIEISAELEVVHDRATKHWPQEPNTLNLWGPHSIMRS